MGDTKIEWTDKTWNPVEGCSMAKGSEAGGCLNCYAARTALRRPSAGLAVMRESGPRWTGKVGLVEKRLTQPLHWRQPKRIFVNSMSDLFHDGLPEEAIDRVFAVMALCPQHTFQVLTKRPERMRAYWTMGGVEDGRLRMAMIFRAAEGMGKLNGSIVAEAFMQDVARALPNIWLGVSVEDFPTWDARVHLLKETPAAVRFVSYEPALADLGAVDLEGVDWLIVGGESGPGARPFDIAWARNTVAQCKASGTACFVKQLGGDPYEIVSHPDYDFEARDLHLKDRKGGDWEEWPSDLRVREFPKTASAREGSVNAGGKAGL
jgi:protein gp37